MIWQVRQGETERARTEFLLEDERLEYQSSIARRSKRSGPCQCEVPILRVRRTFLVLMQIEIFYDTLPAPKRRPSESSDSFLFMQLFQRSGSRRWKIQPGLLLFAIRGESCVRSHKVSASRREYYVGHSRTNSMLLPEPDDFAQKLIPFPMNLKPRRDRPNGASRR